MARGKGSKCPHCGELTFHDEGSVRCCSTCSYVGWAWKQPVKQVGRGKGNKCPNCDNQTLHAVHELGDGRMIRRCGICDFSGLDPAPEA